MTKSILTVISVILLSTVAFAGTPPTPVQKAFEQKFSVAKNIRWTKENSKEWEAEFIYNGTKVSANFSNEGTWIETEMEIPVSELPSKVSTSIKQQNPNCDIVSAYKIERASKPLAYEAEIKIGKKKKEVVLLGDGSIVK